MESRGPSLLKVKVRYLVDLEAVLAASPCELNVVVGEGGESSGEKIARVLCGVPSSG